MADSATIISASLNALNVDGNNTCKSVGDESDDALNTTKDTVFSSETKKKMTTKRNIMAQMLVA